MPFVSTNTIIGALQERLAALPLAASDAAGEKLFHRVDVFGANRLMSAMEATFAAEPRVCFIVPGGDGYTGTRDRNVIFSQRESRIALIIADQVFDGATAAAVIGSPNAAGILALKDRVIEDLMQVPFSGPDLAFVPSAGEPLVLTQAEQPAGNLGRECWLQWLSVYAGSARQAIP